MWIVVTCRHRNKLGLLRMSTGCLPNTGTSNPGTQQFIPNPGRHSQKTQFALIYYSKWPQKTQFALIYYLKWPQKTQFALIYYSKWPQKTQFALIYYSKWPQKTQFALIYYLKWPYNFLICCDVPIWCELLSCAKLLWWAKLCYIVSWVNPQKKFCIAHHINRFGVVCQINVMCQIVVMSYTGVAKTHRMPEVAGHFPQKSHYLQGPCAENNLSR